MAFNKEEFYKNGPKMEKNEHGKMVVKKHKKEVVEKKEAGEDEHDAAMIEMTHKHSSERMDLHHKHEKEMLAHMHKKTEGKMDEVKKPEVKD